MMTYKNLAILQKYVHWNEASAPLLYNSVADAAPCYEDLSAGGFLVDPLGKRTDVQLPSHFNQDETVFVHQGDTHRQSLRAGGNIPLQNFKRHIIIPHTTGLCPYDVRASNEMAALTGTEHAGDVICTDIIKPIFTELFLNTKFDDSEVFYERPYDRYRSLKSYQEELKKWLDEGTVVTRPIEINQYYLEKVKTSIERDMSAVCVALNWCSIRNRGHTMYVVSRLNELVKSMGCKLILRTHSFDHGTNGYLKQIEGVQFEHEYWGRQLNKFESMDAYGTYVVDPTGYGLELAYRARGTGTRIFYMETKCKNQEFGGIETMGLLPEKTLLQFMNNPECESYYPEWIIDGIFHHENVDSIPDLVTNTILEVANNV
ncbi:hypothetical protein [Vibrio phage Va2]|nr:hypothetical protein [Vibrio phage Va2]